MAWVLFVDKSTPTVGVSTQHRAETPAVDFIRDGLGFDRE